MTMPAAVERPALSHSTMALVVYILYLVSYVFCPTALVGVIMAHVMVGESEPVLRSHYQFQIRTFWVGALYLIIGFVLLAVVIGLFVWFWWFIWTLVRIIKGMVLLNEGRPIARPTSWLFG